MRGVVTALREELLKANCARRKVAAVIMTRDGVIVGRGHNRLPLGSCLDGHCPRGQLSYDQQPKDVGYKASGCESIHAEAAALRDVKEWVDGLVMYVTEIPCPGCREEIVRFQIGEVRLLHPDRIGKFQAPV